MTKMIVIGDSATVTGMKLAGLKECIEADKDDVESVLKNVSHDIDIIVISSDLREAAKDSLVRMKDRMIIELPDRIGSGEDMVTRMIRDVIGFEARG